MSKAAFDRYKRIHKRKVISERGFEYTESPCEISTYEDICGEIQRRGWAMFVAEDVSHANFSVVLEFYANYVEMKNTEVFVRGVQVPVGIDTIVVLYNMPTYEQEDDEYHQWAHGDDIN